MVVVEAPFFALNGEELSTLDRLIASEKQFDAGKISSQAEDKAALIEKLVSVLPGHPGDPSVPDLCVLQVKEGLRVYPRSILCFLLVNHCRVLVAPFVTRADPSLDGVHPATYPEGDTFLNCRAVFTTKGVCIGSHFYRHGQILPNSAPKAGVQHEVAHAIDEYLGRPSLSEPFAGLYNEEKDAVSVVDRGPLTYYLSGGRVGPIETFGQLLAHKYSHFNEFHTLTLARCFPRCVKLLNSLFPEND